jgi:hypothetical protein
LLTDEDFLASLAAPDDFALPESLLVDPLFADSELPDELSEDDPLDPFAELSFAAGTLLAPFRLSVR